MIPPAPGPGRGDCAHQHRDDNDVCLACGHCAHTLILNAACYHCGTTELDPIALSPKKLPALVPLDRLRRSGREPTS